MFSHSPVWILALIVAATRQCAGNGPARIDDVEFEDAAHFLMADVQGKTRLGNLKRARSGVEKTRLLVRRCGTAKQIGSQSMGRRHLASGAAEAGRRRIGVHVFSLDHPLVAEFESVG